MRRKIVSILMIALLAATTAWADTTPRPPKTGSTTKRVVWTIVGAGAGFAAGVFLGLNKFDDAVNSDRKVWTTAIVGAAAGGVAGALISRDSGPRPVAAGSRPAPVPQVTWTEAIHGTRALHPVPVR